MTKLYFKKSFHKEIIFILLVIGFLIIAYYQTKDDAVEDALSCETEEQCTMTNYPLGDCCKKCDIFPINKQAFYLEEQQRKETCSNAVCPEFRCLWQTKNIKCIDQKCTLAQ